MTPDPACRCRRQPTIHAGAGKKASNRAFSQAFPPVSMLTATLRGRTIAAEYGDDADDAVEDAACSSGRGAWSRGHPADAGARTRGRARDNADVHQRRGADPSREMSGLP